MGSMRTLARPGRAKLVERRSRFLAFAYPVSTEGEIEALLAALRREYHDAQHIAYAWRLPHKERADDAGEPAGSAGRPILRLLQGEGLEGVLVAVVRYFGGVKLGVGGLARAYRAAAKGALEAAGIVERVRQVQVRLRLPNGRVGEALAVLGMLGARVRAQGYDGEAILVVALPENEVERLRRALSPWAKVEEG